jgi:phage-related protein
VTQWKVEFYQFPNGNSPVLDWYLSQEPQVKAKFARIFDLLQEHGTSVGKPYVAPLDAKLYEIRVEHDTNIYRTIYFAYSGRRFILLHGFQKKTQKTPKKELDLAKNRMQLFIADETKEKERSQTKTSSKKKGKKK